MRSLRLSSLVLCCVAGIAIASATEATRAKNTIADGVPALQLADMGFPELLMHRAAFDTHGNRLAP